jgi:hypothetical protein
MNANKNNFSLYSVLLLVRLGLHVCAGAHVHGVNEP